MEEIIKEKSYKLTVCACYLVQITVGILLNLTGIPFYFLMKRCGLKMSDLEVFVLIHFLRNVLVNITFSKFLDKIGFRLLMIMGTVFTSLSLTAFALAGFATSILWPGILVIASEKNSFGGFVAVWNTYSHRKHRLWSRFVYNRADRERHGET